MSLSSFLLWATLKNKPWISRDRISLWCNMLTYSLPRTRSSRVPAPTMVCNHFTLLNENQIELAGRCIVDVFSVHFLCELTIEWPSSTLPKTRKSWLNAFWLLSVGLHGLSVHFCLGLHNVGKKKLSFFSSKNAKKTQKSDQKPLRRSSIYCSARARRTQWRRKLQPAWKNNQVRLPHSFNGYNHPSLSYFITVISIN